MTSPGWRTTSTPSPHTTNSAKRRVLDSGGRFVGQVENLYVDDDRELQFVDVVTSGFLGFGKEAPPNPSRSHKRRRLRARSR